MRKGNARRSKVRGDSRYAAVDATEPVCSVVGGYPKIPYPFKCSGSGQYRAYVRNGQGTGFGGTGNYWPNGQCWFFHLGFFDMHGNVGMDLGALDACGGCCNRSRGTKPIGEAGRPAFELQLPQLPRRLALRVGFQYTLSHPPTLIPPLP